MKNKILKEINVEEIMESLKKDSKKNSYLKVLWNGKNIEVDLNFEDFEKEIDEMTKDFSDKVDALFKEKEAEVMKI
mgnify:CR=1 FL=1